MPRPDSPPSEPAAAGTAPDPAGSTGSTASTAGRARRAIAYVPALDGLRGVAVAAVLANHAGHLTGGWLGVDLFFALSGYLITTLLLMDHTRSADGGVRLRRFWSRRVRRLGPALVLTLLGVAVYARFVAVPVEAYGIRWDGIATLFEAANWRNIVTGSNYWSASSTLPPSPLNHTWSLSIEEQIYVVWPLVVAGLLLWRKRPRAVAVAAAVGAVASVGMLVGLHAAGASNIRLYEGTDTRLSTLLFGAFVAAVRIHLGPARWKRLAPLRRGLGLIGAATLAVLWCTLDGAGSLPYQGLLPVAGVAGALVVASLTERRHAGPLAAALSVRPLRELGRISYGVYLYHWPIFLWLSPSRVGWRGWPLIALQVGVTLVVATVSFVLVESPIRRGVPAGRPARAAVPAAAALSVLALLTATWGAVPPPSFDAFAPQLFRSADPNAPTVLMAGDSVPLLLAMTMTGQVDELQINMSSVAAPGCHLLAADSPIRGIEGNIRTDTGDCREDGTIRDGVRRFDPDVSILMFGEFPNESVRLDGRWVMACDPPYQAAYRRRLVDAIHDLQITGKPVVLVTAPGTSVSWILDRVKPGMPRRVQCMNDLLREVADTVPKVGLVDLASYVCPTPTRCLDQIDGIDLRPDGLHFKDASAALVNRWLVPRALAAANSS